MLSYPARIQRDGEGFVVSFPDIPEALTGAATREEALAMAADALTTAMDFYFEDRRPVARTLGGQAWPGCYRPSAQRRGKGAAAERDAASAREAG
jgi:predicted RNase H-like HicB family nuclease